METILENATKEEDEDSMLGLNFDVLCRFLCTREDNVHLYVITKPLHLFVCCVRVCIVQEAYHAEGFSFVIIFVLH